MEALRTAKVLSVALVSFLLPLPGFIFLYKNADVATSTNYQIHSLLLLAIFSACFYIAYIAYQAYEARRESQLFLIAVAFLIFGISFLLHAFSVPIFKLFNEAVFDATEHGGMFLGALLLLGLAVPGKTLQKIIQGRERRILAGVTLLILAIFFFILFYPKDTLDTLGDLVAMPAVLLLSTVILILAVKYRYLADILLTHLVAGFAVLVNAGVISLFYEQWGALWWYMHFVTLAGFLIILRGFIRREKVQYPYRAFGNTYFFNRIGARVWIIVWVGIVLLFVASTMSYVFIRQTNRSFDVLQYTIGAMHVVMDTEVLSSGIIHKTDAYIDTTDDRNQRLALEKTLEEINHHMAYLEQFVAAHKNGDEWRPFLSRLKIGFSDIRQNIEYVFAYIDSGAANVATELEPSVRNISAGVQRIIIDAEGWHKSLDKQIRGAEEVFSDAQRSATMLNSFLVLFFGGYVLFAGIIVLRWTITPVEKLTATVQKIAEGDISLRAKVTREDELGILAKSFNRMTDKLTEEKDRAESEARNVKKFQQAVDASNNGVVITDDKANIIYVNRAWSKLTGYTPEEVVGKNPNILKSDKTSPNVYTDMWTHLNAGEAFVSEDITNKHKDGTEHHVRLSVSPVIQGGKTIFYVGITEDITRRKQIDKMKSEFIAIASHQLRTPLTSIRWVIELFLKKEKLTEQGKEYLDDIHTSARKLSELVDILLNVSRIEEGGIAISPQPLDVIDFLKNYIRELNPVLDKKNIELNFKHPEQLTISTDESAFRNVAQSVISNAIEYTMSGGKIDVLLERNENEFYLTVADTGIGIPKDEHAHIAEKFTRGSNAMLIKTDGTGMGLYIAYRAVESLGGKIWFESEENKGTTFHIKLPIEAEIKKGKKLV